MATPVTGAHARLTVEEYEALGEDAPGERWELDAGKVIVSAASRSRHNQVRDALASRLRRFVRAADLGGVLTETDVTLDERTVRRPDIMWYSAARWKSLDHDAWGQPAPDLVVEIVSDSDRADQLMKKVGQYLQAGVAAVWLLYPKLGLAHRYHAADAPPQVLSAADTLAEPDLLPAFAALLSEVFAALDD